MSSNETSQPKMMKQLSQFMHVEIKKKVRKFMKLPNFIYPSSKNRTQTEVIQKQQKKGIEQNKTAKIKIIAETTNQKQNRIEKQ